MPISIEEDEKILTELGRCFINFCYLEVILGAFVFIKNGVNYSGDPFKLLYGMNMEKKIAKANKILSSELKEKLEELCSLRAEIAHRIYRTVDNAGKISYLVMNKAEKKFKEELSVEYLQKIGTKAKSISDILIKEAVKK